MKKKSMFHKKGGGNSKGNDTFMSNTNYQRIENFTKKDIQCLNVITNLPYSTLNILFSAIFNSLTISVRHDARNMLKFSFHHFYFFIFFFISLLTLNSNK